MSSFRELDQALTAPGQYFEIEARDVGQLLMRAQPDFKLEPYAKRCPFQGEVLDRWIERLRQAGLPD